MHRQRKQIEDSNKGANSLNAQLALHAKKKLKYRGRGEYTNAKGLIEKIRHNPHESFRHMLVMFWSNHRPNTTSETRKTAHGLKLEQQFENLQTTEHICIVLM